MQMDFLRRFRKTEIILKKKNYLNSILIYGRICILFTDNFNYHLPLDGAFWMRSITILLLYEGDDEENI